MIIIGLVGKKLAGKDTFADIAILSSIRNRMSSIKMGFADALKSEICIAINSVNALYGGPTHDPMTPKFINNNKERFRQMLQWWGTDYRRDMCGQTYWLEKMFARIKSVNPTAHEYLLIPDVRFVNEAKLIKDLGGFLMKINRTKSPIQTDIHQSETELDNIVCEYIINNYGTLDEFRDRVLVNLSLMKESQKSKLTVKV